MKNIFRSILFLALITLSSTFSHAMEEGSHSYEKNPDMMAQMSEAYKLMAPSEAHELLKSFEGSWVYAGQFWMTPDSESQVMQGTAENTLIFNGRFLKEVIKGPWMGMEFEGHAILGYDNVKETYISTWFDNMATGIMYSSGDYDAETQTLHQSGTHSCAMTGQKDRFGRSEWQILEDDHIVYRSFTLDADGNEYKMMELHYSRKA